MINWIEAIALAAFTAGLMGGVHCAAMCGAVVCLLNGGQRTSATATHWRFVVAYNAGRVSSYMVAGVLAGAVGQTGLLLRDSLPAQQILMLTASVTLCLMALYLAGVSPLMRALEGAGSTLWRRLEPMARYVLPVTSVSRALGLGALWGWLPCGMVYAALLLAASTGNPVEGALVMAAFGTGTLPNMMLIAGCATRMQRALKRRGVRWAAATLLAAAGLWGVIHASHPNFAAAAQFCRDVLAIR